MKKFRASRVSPAVSVTLMLTALVTIMLVCLVACGISVDTNGADIQAETTTGSEIDDSLRFVKLAEYDEFIIICNIKTRVMYSVSDSIYNSGNLTVLVNQDGSPMLYEGELPANYLQVWSSY